MTYDDGDLKELIEALRSFASAYPTSRFSPLTGEERERLHVAFPNAMDRTAATMGRHLAPYLENAADAIEYLMAARQESKTKLADVKAGDMLVAESGPPCLQEGATYQVHADDGLQRGMRVQCNDPGEPRHFLVADVDGYLIGFRKMSAPPSSDDAGENRENS